MVPDAALWTQAATEGSASQADGHPVPGALDVDVGSVLQHVVAHVGEDNAPAAEVWSLFGQGLVVEVELHLLFKEIGFADEQVGAVRHLRQ
jgi:hypothetical protein